MSPSGRHFDNEVELITLSTDDEGELRSDRGGDQKEIVELESTDSEQFCSDRGSDQDLDIVQVASSDSDEFNDGESDSIQVVVETGQRSTKARHCSDNDSSEWLPCSTPKEPVKEDRLQITTADSRTKAKPNDYKLSKQSSKESTQRGGNCSILDNDVDRKHSFHRSKLDDLNEKRGNPKNGADEHRAIWTKRKVRRKIKNWHRNDSRSEGEEHEFTLPEAVLPSYYPKQAVIRRTAIRRTDSTAKNREIDRKEKSTEAAETNSSTSGEFDPEFDFRAINEVLRDSLHVWGDNANDIHFLRTWFSREKSLLENGLSMTLSDQEIQGRKDLKAGISVAMELGQQFDPAKLVSLRKCEHEDVMEGLLAYRSSLHRKIKEIHAKNTKALADAKRNAELAIKGIVKAVQKAADAIPVHGCKVDHLGSQ